MRHPRELSFRLRQEIANALLFAFPPHGSSNIKAPLHGLPHPTAAAQHLRGSAYAAHVEQLAASVLQHRFPLLGGSTETGPEIAWSRDYRSGRETPASYFRTIPYLDVERCGDHKIVWELNRHQHLVLLAQSWLLTGNSECLVEIQRELESWWAANPYGRGINWASALEVAFRALSWIWVYHFTGEHMEPHFRRHFLESLYAHGCHLEHNLSVYFSPNTHLLGEAVALHALGTLFPDFPHATRWRAEAGAMVRAQMDAQVHADGSHFEQSAYYHVYALDMLLFPAILDPMPPDYLAKLAHMADYLDALLGLAPHRRLPLIGDDDGGRFFHPYGERDAFGCASLAACARFFRRSTWTFQPEDAAEIAAWWFDGETSVATPAQSPHSRFFENAGIAVMQATDVHIVADTGPFGPGGAGHSHSDTLSLTVRRGAEDLLIDAGTYTYVADPKSRNWFRGSAAHNTIRIDELDQAIPIGPFRWQAKPEVEVLAWRSSDESDFLDAACAYRGFRHRRRIVFCKPGLIFILDEIEGPTGDHLIEQFWHSGAPVTQISPRSFRIGEAARLTLSHNADLKEGGEHGWRSRTLGERSPAPVIRAATRSGLPARMAAALELSPQGPPGALEISNNGSEIVLALTGHNATGFAPHHFWHGNR